MAAAGRRMVQLIRRTGLARRLVDAERFLGVGQGDERLVSRFGLDFEIFEQAGVELGGSIGASSLAETGQLFAVGVYGPSYYPYEVYSSANGKILYCSETGAIIVITEDGFEYPLETAIV